MKSPLLPLLKSGKTVFSNDDLRLYWIISGDNYLKTKIYRLVRATACVGLPMVHTLQFRTTTRLNQPISLLYHPMSAFALFWHRQGQCFSLIRRCCINQDHALKRTAKRRRRQKVPLRGTGMALSQPRRGFCPISRAVQGMVWIYATTHYTRACYALSGLRWLQSSGEHNIWRL